ncbi:unnamed protein product [Acanthoscelides obtectus]|uniref:Uncharacterized protein n=1 Tax=Acanthoscelides obtectus TaxID=200917 RepID=A0A9P0LHA1_ACAOB|nr:unnamed protein product [Acanthoscelides obtectus]CAK1632875.1 hypothetical protein AOBTE_LOCUS7783 [Acanthoscelides obtectus]
MEVIIDNVKLQQVHSFKYLGAILEPNGRNGIEISEKIGKASNLYYAMSKNACIYGEIFVVKQTDSFVNLPPDISLGSSEIAFIKNYKLSWRSALLRFNPLIFFLWRLKAGFLASELSMLRSPQMTFLLFSKNNLSNIFPEFFRNIATLPDGGRYTHIMPSFSLDLPEFIVSPQASISPSSDALLTNGHPFLTKLSTSESTESEDGHTLLLWFLPQRKQPGERPDDVNGCSCGSAMFELLPPLLRVPPWLRCAAGPRTCQDLIGRRYPIWSKHSKKRIQQCKVDKPNRCYWMTVPGSQKFLVDTNLIPVNHIGSVWYIICSVLGNAVMSSFHVFRLK